MDWPSVANTFVATLPATIAALGALWKIWKDGKETKAVAKETHAAVNGKMSEMLEIAKAGAAAEATVVEKDAQGVREVAAAKAAKE